MKKARQNRAIPLVLFIVAAMLLSLIMTTSCADKRDKAPAKVTENADADKESETTDTDSAEDEGKDKEADSDEEDDKDKDEKDKKEDDKDKDEKETDKKDDKEKDKDKENADTDKKETTANGNSGAAETKETTGGSGGASQGSSSSTSTDDIVISGNVSGGSSSGSSGSSSGSSSGNSSSGGSSSGGDTSQPSGDAYTGGYGLQTETGGLVHCAADAPVSYYEDLSNTLSYAPMRQEGATDPNGYYNTKRVSESDMRPGFVYYGGQDYSTTYFGYDGFLFCGDTLSDYDGTSLYVQERLNSLVNNMVKRNEWVESQGKKMYIVFIPNKNSVYPEYMPPGYSMGSYRRIDQVRDALRDAGINVVDGRESLLAAKAANPQRLLYYKTDTHWNNHGGFEVYTQLMNVIKQDFPNVVVHSRSDYQINYCETYMKDQTYYIGYYDATSEIGPVYTLKNGVTAMFNGSRPKDVWGQYTFCYKWPNGYSDHLYYYRWQNNANTAAPSMYMLRDSYSIALNGFLKDSFYRSTYNWSFGFSKSEILNSKADVIIIEVVEKNIQNFFAQLPYTD